MTWDLGRMTLPRIAWRHNRDAPLRWEDPERGLHATGLTKENGSATGEKGQENGKCHIYIGQIRKDICVT